MAGSTPIVVVSLNDDPARPGAGPGHARMGLLARRLAESRGALLITRSVTAGPARADHVLHLPSGGGPPDDFEHLRHGLPSLIDELDRLLRRVRPNVVLSYGWAAAVAAHAACQAVGIPIVTVVDDPGSPAVSPPGPALARLEASVAAASAAVLTGSSAVAVRLMRSGVARRAMHPLPMPVLAPARPASPGRARQGNRVAVLGRSDRHDDAGVARALRAVSCVDGAEAVVVPGPPGHEAAWADYWSGPGRLLDEAAVVVHASEAAPTGHEAVVTMSRAAPLVASATGAHVDILEDGINGLLVPVRAQEALVRAVRDLLDDRFAAAAIAAAAHDAAEQRHTADRAVAEVSRVLDLVVEGEPTIEDPDDDRAGSEPPSLSKVTA